ncbi:MAG: ABC transporter substrate-binding protein, partial [Clostridium sp.]|nr:ABC transporter substrate-binding protein [Clostridium sp.]
MDIIKIKRIISFILSIICFAALVGCNKDYNSVKADKELVFGTTSSTKSLDPANGYSGWYTVRYGVAETLFKLSSSMEIENWLADGYEYINPTTVKIILKKNIKFQNGKEMTSESVKKSIMRSVQKNVRAASTLNIESIETGENYIVIKTTKENPTLINELCDPYASIIDVDEENINEKPIGTGPFKVESFDYTSASTFVKNNDYWNGDVKLDSLKVISITDSDILSMALQSGEIDAAQGLSYAMIDQFSKDNKYKIDTV